MNILYCLYVAYFTVLECGDVCHIFLLISGSFRYSKRMRLFHTPPFLQVSQSIVSMMWPILYATFLQVSKSGTFHTPPFSQVSKSIVYMVFYSLFIPWLFCVNNVVSHSFIITPFKINDSFKSSIFLFSFFLAKNQASVSPS